VGGIARKAIEEGWKPQESVIEIEYQEQQKTIATAQEQKKTSLLRWKNIIIHSP
jgi:hypothetical protein